MLKIELDGEVYYYNNGVFTDSSFIEVDVTTMKKLSGLLFVDTDYKNLSKNELLKFVTEAKEVAQYQLTKDACIYGMEKYEDDPFFITRILPVITSCYRLVGDPKGAIEIASKYLNSFKYESVALLTSLAAAYCDIKDYDNALKCAKKAYAKQGGGTGSKTELSLVFMRIKKEMGE